MHGAGEAPVERVAVRRRTELAARKAAVMDFLATQNLLIDGRRVGTLEDLCRAVAVASGANPRLAPPPDASTLFRWTTPTNVASESDDSLSDPRTTTVPATHGSQDAVVTGFATALAAGTDDDIVKRGVLATRAELLGVIERLTGQVLTLHANVCKAGSSTKRLKDDCAQAKTFAKSIRRRERPGRFKPWEHEHLAVRARDLSQLRQRLTDVLANGPAHACRGAPRQNSSSQGIGAVTLTTTTTTADTPVTPMVIRTDVAEDLQRLPIYRQPANPSDPIRADLSTQFADVTLLAYGTRAGHATDAESEAEKGERDAEVRAELVAPILSGELGYREAAAFWQRRLRGKELPTDPLRSISDPSAALRYHAISDATLRRWVEKVRAENDAARLENRPPRSPADVLRHRQPNRKSGVEKLSSTLQEALLTRLQQDGTMSAAMLARHLNRALERAGGQPVSERSVQRWVAQNVPDIARGIARGGPRARDQIFRVGFIRQCPYPNRAWVIDNSFFAQEVVDSEHPEYARQLKDLDLDFGIECVRRLGSGRAGRRVTRLCMTVIKDACTRRRLAVRLWDGAPNARTTLLAVLDAALRFGMPEMLYSDNGTEFRNGAVGRALRRCGIQQVFSKPGTPQSRGLIEREMRTIKELAIPEVRRRLNSTQPFAELGNKSLSVAPDLAVVERVLKEEVDKLDDLVHSETGRSPREHFATEIGERGMLTEAQQASITLDLLIMDDQVLRTKTGVVVQNRRYFGPGLELVPIGKRVCVSFDPYHPGVAHLRVRTADGSLRYLSPLLEYSEENPAPDPVEWAAFSARWRDVAGLDTTAKTAAKQRVAALGGLPLPSEHDLPRSAPAHNRARVSHRQLASRAEPLDAQTATADAHAPNTDAPPDVKSTAPVLSGEITDTRADDPSLIRRRPRRRVSLLADELAGPTDVATVPWDD